METFYVQILGCGSALPTMRHNGSSQLVNVREKLFLVDCAEGTQMQLRRNKVRFPKINSVFISHLHGDHCFGLMGFISTLGLLGRTACLRIFGPKGTREVFAPQLKFFCATLSFDVEIIEFDSNVSEMIYDDRSLSVYTLPLKHRIPCCGFLFREKETSRHIRRDVIDAYKIPISQINNIKAGMDYVLDDGEVIPNSILTSPPAPARSYAYCSDTLYNESLVSLIRDCNLLYHEATFSEKDGKTAHKTGHSTALEAGNIALKANVGKLLLGHFSSRYENENILLEEAKSVFENTFLVNENMKFSI